MNRSGRIRESESESFRIDSGVRQGYIVSPLLFNVYMDAVVKMGMGRRGENGDYIEFCVASRRRT